MVLGDGNEQERKTSRRLDSRGGGDRIPVSPLLSWTVWAFQKVVAFSFIPLPGLVKFAAGICCVNLLP